MASNLRTPASVLEAPTRSVTADLPLGASRSERRHGVVMPKDLDHKLGAAFLRLINAHTNEPFVRTTPRRGKKVRRGGLA